MKSLWLCQILHFIKSMMISFKVRHDCKWWNYVEVTKRLILPILKLHSLLNEPVSLPLISLRFTKKTFNHIKCFIFNSLLVFSHTHTHTMNNLTKEKYLQQCKNSTVFIRILPPEASLSKLNLNYFFGFLIKVCSGFLVNELVVLLW